MGAGREPLIEHHGVKLVDSDGAFRSCINLICDEHCLPFEDNSFDGVIVQAVFEHVVDPWRCVEEIYRALKEDGLVYAETPFMQQAQGSRYDFTRFIPNPDDYYVHITSNRLEKLIFSSTKTQ